MIRLIIVSVASILFLSACDQMSETASKTASATTGPTTEEEKTFYALGVAIAQSLEQFELSEDEIVLVQSGIGDTMTGVETDVDLQEYQAKIAELRNSRLAAAASKTKTAAAGFLSKAAAAPGAQSFDSGLVMVEMVPGDGAQPAATDKVTVHYHGTLPDGTVFDSSVERGAPASFPLNGVIPCWTEGVQKIKVGGKAKLICPSDIAYGDRGRPPTIPPGATLVFEVELLSIEGAE